MRNNMRYLFLLALFVTLSSTFAEKLQVTKKVLFDIEIEGQKLGKIEIGLFGRIVPKTVDNFAKLCENSVGSGYKKTKFFRIVPEHIILGGDFFRGDGTRGYTGYKGQPRLRIENFKLNHCSAGWVSMVVHDREIDSRFFFVLKPMAELDNTHIVFGKVIKGMDVVWEIHASEIDKNGTPIRDVIIANCTVEKVKKKFIVSSSDSTE